MVKVFLDHLTKIFPPATIAVNDMSLEIPDKKVSCLLGPSGCGKTTTMRIVAGLETPTSGRVYFDGQDMTGVPTRDRDVAMVYQFAVVYPALTVYENIAFPLRARKLVESEIREKVKAVSELLGLRDILNMQCSKLGLDAKQRVQMARAIVRTPKVYLFDEPLSNLDPTSRVKLRADIAKLQRELQQTVIYVTHDQAEALTMGDFIGVMNYGKLLQFDTSENIYNNPKNSFVAWFIGDPGMNLLDCTFSETKGKSFLETSAFRYDVTDIANTIKDKKSSDELLLGIRPEHIAISARKEGDEWIEASCIAGERIGNRTLLHLQIGDVSIKAKSPLGFKAKKVWINLPIKNVKVYDKKTGELLN
jgi:multiple sugar transport system ATP-binding protein